MLTSANLNDFAAVAYKDSAFKNSLIVWTFVLLVLPASLLIAIGVPEKPTYIAMAGLLLPVAIGLRMYRRRQLLTKDSRSSLPEISEDTKAHPEPAVRPHDPSLHADVR